jgi:outer membrane lipoprotein-sorting protein
MKKRNLIVLFSLAVTLNMTAQDKEIKPLPDPARTIEQVNAFSQQTSTIKADFIQEKEMSFMEESVSSSGKFYFQKEKLLRWEYTNPFNYAIILNNNRIRIMDEGKNKDFDAGSNRMFIEISDIMSGMVNGSLLNSDKFRATWFESPEHYIVEMVPVATAMKDYLSMIRLDISKKDYSVDGLKMVEKSGDFTRITFRNKQFNEAIPAEIFAVD